MAEPTGSIIRMPKVENALGQSTTSAASQKAVTDGITQAKSAASTADGKAVTAQNTATDAQTAANGAKTAADNAQKTANEAKTAAGTAQTAATNANNNANGRVPSGRKVNGKALTADISLTAADVGALTKAQADGYYQPKGSSSGVTLGALETATERVDGGSEGWRDASERVSEGAIRTIFGIVGGTTGQNLAWRGKVPTGAVVCGYRTNRIGYNNVYDFHIEFRRITGGI